MDGNAFSFEKEFFFHAVFVENGRHSFYWQVFSTRSPRWNGFVVHLPACDFFIGQ
jgi:hypothetical protein